MQVAILHEGKRRWTFVRGVEHVIRCWIGIDDPTDPRPRGAANKPIRTARIPEGGALLQVHVLYNDEQAVTGQIVLPPKGDSTTCDVAVTIDPDDSFPTLEIAFLFRGRVFESVRVNATSVESPEIDDGDQGIQVRVRTSRRQVEDLHDRPDMDATLVTHDEQILAFSHGEGRQIPLDQLSDAIDWLNDEIFVTDKKLVRQRTQQATNSEPRLEHDSPVVRDMLRRLARQGHLLHRDLGYRDRTARRIHVVNTASRYIQPVEFVYDRGAPKRGSKLCDGWEAALSGDADECPTCTPAHLLTDADRAQADRICPLGFWGLRKIIERQEQREQSLNVNPSPTHQRSTLPRPESALFGASAVVKEADREATLALLRDQFGSTAMTAASWPEWRSRVQDPGASLLVALPHQGFDAEDRENYLEIGGTRLHQPDLDSVYVKRDVNDPGPIVLVLGCRTQAASELGYSSMARDFLTGRAAIVVGTVAQVLGRHAAPAVQEITRQLLADDQGTTTFGELMRRVRRRMLLRGYLMALSIIALGDADWLICNQRS